MRIKCYSSQNRKLIPISLASAVTSNFQLNCCQLPIHLRHLAETHNEVIDDQLYEVLGFDAKPDPDLHKEDWKSQFCNGTFASTIYVQPRNKTLLHLKCLEKDPVIVRSKTCPYYMTGFYVHQDTTTKLVSEVGIYCIGSDKFQVYKNSSKANTNHHPMHYKCSIGYGVCGVMFSGADGYQYSNCSDGRRQDCALLPSGYLCELTIAV